MKTSLSVLFLLLSQIGFPQDYSNRVSKSVYVLYGHNFKTNYVADSGQNNLIGRKNVFSAEMGLNLDYPINNRFKLRTGIAGHLLFLDETGYGASGPIPDGFGEDAKRLIPIYSRGAEYIESVSIGIPIKLLYKFYSNPKYNFSISAGPFLSFYFPARDEMAGFTDLKQNGEYTQKYWVTRRFKSGNNSLNVSSPQLEWDFDIQTTRKLKKYGAVSLGIKSHIGTTRLEHASFIIWPDEPNHRSKGHFTLNRSYIGIFGAFTFGRMQ
jgi:hypothetical protein